MMQNYEKSPNKAGAIDCDDTGSAVSAENRTACSTGAGSSLAGMLLNGCNNKTGGDVGIDKDAQSDPPDDLLAMVMQLENDDGCIKEDMPCNG